MMKPTQETSLSEQAKKLRRQYFSTEFWSRLGKKLRTQFLAGIVVMVPVAVTIWVLVWIFSTIDNILQPVINYIVGRHIPGIGFGVTIILIYLAGVVATNIIGRRLIGWGESQLNRVPLVRLLYQGIKQIMESFSTPNKTSFMQTVFVEFPRKGMWAIGFVTQETSAQSGEKLLNVLIPTSPNPMTGFLQIVREDEIIRTNIPIDAAFRMLISAGKVSPQEISLI